MEKIDFKKTLDSLYRPSAKEVAELDVPTLQYLMIDGQGDPNTSPAYAQAVQALFGIAYKAKFLVRKMLAIDYGVMPLEGLWWADEPSMFQSNDKSQWQWTMMIMQPALVTPEILAAARVEAENKQPCAAIGRVRLESLTEGTCAQILHVGPFCEEGPTIDRLHRYIEARGTLGGKHHEIYLSDIRKTDPARWKTILRQPMRPAASR